MYILLACVNTFRIVLYIVAMWISGVMQGLMWRAVNEDGTLSGIVLDGEHESMGDVQAGIEFIYHMREHLLDVGIATVYLISVYAIVLWLKKKLS